MASTLSDAKGLLDRFKISLGQGDLQSASRYLQQLKVVSRKLGSRVPFVLIPSFWSSLQSSCHVKSCNLRPNQRSMHNVES